MKKAEPSRWHAVVGERGAPSLAPTSKLRAILVAGKGELLAEQLAAQRIFRQNLTTEDAPLPRKAETPEEVTQGLGLERGLAEQIQRVIGNANAHFDQKSQTQRIFLATGMLTEVLRALPDVSSDQRMELVKRAQAYWRHTDQTDYGKAPTVRYVAHKSEPSLVIKAEQLGLDFSGPSTSTVERPPPGYTAVPNSKHGGYRKRSGKGYVYWYPEGKGPKTRKKKAKPTVDVWGPLSHASVKQWRQAIGQAAKLQSEIKEEARAIFEPQWKAWLEKPPEEKLGQSFFENIVIPEDFEKKYAQAHDAVAALGRNLQQWAIEHVAEIPLGADPDTLPMYNFGTARRDIAKKARKVKLSEGFPVHYPAPGSAGGKVQAGLAQILNDDFEGKAWATQLRRARGLLKSIDTFVADIDAEKSRRRPISTFNRGGVTFVIHGEGIGAGPVSEAVIEKPVKEVERMQQKLQARGLGKALEGLRVHVHYRTRLEAEGQEHQGRSDFTSAGYYHVNEDYVRLFTSGITENTLTHELGHRVYFQLMGNQGRREWEKFYEDRREQVSKDDIETLADLLIEAEEEYRKRLGSGVQRTGGVLVPALKKLPAEGGTPQEQRLRFLLKQVRVSGMNTQAPDIPDYRMGAEEMAEAFRQGIRSGMVESAFPDEFVTKYAETNPEELFAEAFEDYVVKGPRGLPPRIRDQIERALLSTGMQLKKADEEPELAKAEGAPKAGHKYIKRVPYMKDGKRRYRYYYRESAVARDVQAGEEVKLGKQLAKILKVDEKGHVTIQVGKVTQKVSPAQWNELLSRHYGQRYFDWAEKRAAQTVNAVLKHVPRELLQDLKGTDAERLEQLKTRVPEVYAKLRKSFGRSGVSPFRAKHVLSTVLGRRGWLPEARAAVIGQVIEDRTTNYRQLVRGAENLAGGKKVRAGHVQGMAEIQKPASGKRIDEEVADVAKRAERELAALSAALSRAESGGTPEAAKALEAALSSPHVQKLVALAQAMPGLKDRALEPSREALLRTQAIVPEKPKGIGGDTTVYVSGEDGQPRALRARYKVVEADQAIASHKPGTFSKRENYPAGVQERAYHRDKDEQAKVIRNAQKLNPAFLVNTNPDAVNGPPILDQNGIVLGGNSRTMSMQLAYEQHPERAKALRAYLTEHAHEVGLNKADIEGMKNPILVREITTEGEAEQKLLVRQMNESFTQGMDPRTMQVALGRKVDEAALKALGDAMEPDETLGAFLDSPRAEGFINALRRAGVIDQRNANQYMVKGTKRLNEDGKQLVERVLVGRTVGDADLLSNTGSKLISNIARAVPLMTQAKSYGAGYDVGPDLKTALEAYNDLQYRAQQGHRAALKADMSDKEFSQLFSQTEMFGETHPVTESPRAMAMLEVLIRQNGPTKMARVFRDYAARAAQHPEDQQSMFGDAPSPTELFVQVAKGEKTEKSLRPTLIVKGGGHKYKRRWRGPDGEWRYEYAEPIHARSREEFLGNPKRTKASNAADLVPKHTKLTEHAPAEDWPVGGESYKIHRGYSEDGKRATYVITYQGAPIAKYDGTNLVVSKKHRGKGIATHLVADYRTENPHVPVADQRTAAAQKVQEAAWELIQKRKHSGKMEKGGPYIGPKGGKWADAKHTIPWKESKPAIRAVRPQGNPKRELDALVHAIGAYQGGADDKTVLKVIERAGFTGEHAQRLLRQARRNKNLAPRRVSEPPKGPTLAQAALDRVKRGEQLVVQKGSTPMHQLHVPIMPVSGSAPRFYTPPIPDYQEIYFQPESTEKQKKQREHEETRRRADAERNRGTYGLHGRAVKRKPIVRWEGQRSAMASYGLHDPDQPGRRAPRKQPKLVARIKAGQTEHEPETQKKKKRKKQTKLVAKAGA